MKMDNRLVDLTLEGMGCQQLQIYAREIQEHFRQERRLRQDLEAAHQAVFEGCRLHIRSLAATIEARNPYTGGHVDRVRDYGVQLARRLKLSEEEVENFKCAAELHDLGKLSIPDSILLKPGPLAPPEWAEMRRHPERGEEMVQHIPFLKGALPIIRGHHERHDGNGYPDGLMAEATPLGARILAVVDAYDAMTTDRPYRLALTHQEALKRLREGAGSQWDPTLVGVFLEIVAE